MGEFRLETPRLVLRDWREEDWEAYFRFTNRPAVMRWLGGVADERGMKAGRERIEHYRREHGHTFWLVERKLDGGHLSGEPLGFCGLKRANQKGGPIGDFEIGWRLREDAWGKGYALESATASMASGFEDWGAPHMIALTVQDNTASWGLMERLSMKRRPDLDFECDDSGAVSGTILAYSITRQQWQTSR